MSKLFLYELRAGFVVNIPTLIFALESLLPELIGEILMLSSRLASSTSILTDWDCDYYCSSTAASTITDNSFDGSSSFGTSGVASSSSLSLLCYGLG
jgi:hypothetical protein